MPARRPPKETIHLASLHCIRLQVQDRSSGGFHHNGAQFLHDGSFEVLAPRVFANNRVNWASLLFGFGSYRCSSTPTRNLHRICSETRHAKVTVFHDVRQRPHYPLAPSSALELPTSRQSVASTEERESNGNSLKIPISSSLRSAGGGHVAQLLHWYVQHQKARWKQPRIESISLNIELQGVVHTKHVGLGSTTVARVDAHGVWIDPLTFLKDHLLVPFHSKRGLCSLLRTQILKCSLGPLQEKAPSKQCERMEWRLVPTSTNFFIARPHGAPANPPRLGLLFFRGPPFLPCQFLHLFLAIRLQHSVPQVPLHFASLAACPVIVSEIDRSFFAKKKLYTSQLPRSLCLAHQLKMRVLYILATVEVFGPPDSTTWTK